MPRSASPDGSNIAPWRQNNTRLTALHLTASVLPQINAMSLKHTSGLASFLAIGDYTHAFALYEANRSARTARMQSVSRTSEWLRSNEDPSWVYDYDVFNVPLAMPDVERFSTMARRSGSKPRQIQRAFLCVFEVRME